MMNMAKWLSLLWRVHKWLSLRWRVQGLVQIWRLDQVKFDWLFECEGGIQTQYHDCIS